MADVENIPSDLKSLRLTRALGHVFFNNCAELEGLVRAFPSEFFVRVPRELVLHRPPLIRPVGHLLPRGVKGEVLCPSEKAASSEQSLTRRAPRSNYSLFAIRYSLFAIRYSLSPTTA
jgi:hypothetical protein